MANRRKIREEDKEYILAFWETQTVDEIAKHLGISPRTMARWANELGLPEKYNRGNSGKKPYGTRSHRLVDMSIRVKKCCAICEMYDKCSVSSKLDTLQARKMVCWNFNVSKDLELV